MTAPTPTEAMAMAAGHILNGVPEIELAWELDAPTADGDPRQLVVTMRGADRWARINQQITRDRESGDQP